MRWLVPIGLGLLALMLWRLDVATTTVTLQKQQLTQLRQSLADKNGQLTAINLMAEANDRFQVGLQQNTDTLKAALVSRDKQIKGLIHENVALKRWADTPLPADIIRLQQRPALVGAAAYRAYLSDGDALPTAR